MLSQQPHLAREAGDALAAVEAHHRRRAAARRKHRQDAGAAADVQHTGAADEPRVALQRITVRVGARLRVGSLRKVVLWGPGGEGPLPSCAVRGKMLKL